VLAAWLNQEGAVLDQGLTLYFPAPASFTGEDVVELQGHGSPVMLRALLTRLFELGCRPAEAGEFSRRAVENGKLDLTQAEAIVACIDSATVRAGKQAQLQLQGVFGQRIDMIMHALTSLVAHVEASLDFPEEEIPDLYFTRLEQQLNEQVIKPVRELIATAKVGERLFDGATVAIVGAPNVGKSSLLNALAGRDRAIVSDIPGTTRDILEVDFEVHGIPVRLADTAGLRSSDDLIEQEGVRRAREAAVQADVIIHVADIGRPDTWHCDVKPDISIMNKSDLLNVEYPAHFIAMSVKEGSGLESLQDQLARLLGDSSLDEGGVLVTRERHRSRLSDALGYAEEGLVTLHDESRLELTAMQWRMAWSSLGEILGIGDVEYILDAVFSEFCIGK